jgi:hypothetical protein
MGRSRKLIPVEKHENYALLWSLAETVAQQGATAAEACWLEIMDAFWSGKIQALYCFMVRKSGPGRELYKLPSREVIAEWLLEREGPPNYAALRGWSLEDYLGHEPFRSFPTRNARFGIAIKLIDFERLRPEVPSLQIPVVAKPGRFSRTSAMNFAREYIARVEQLGHQPTQVGLEKAAQEGGKKGGRELIREAFRKLRHKAGNPVKRGPPRRVSD